MRFGTAIAAIMPIIATPPSSGYTRREAHPSRAGDVVLILVAVNIVDEEGAGGVRNGVALGCGEAGDEDAPQSIRHI
jgi:hypothetical protein